MSDDQTLPIGPSDDDATLPVDAAGAADPTIGADARIGSTIGPYHLVSRLGEGGMGEVFLAEQTEPIRRQVALKVIKPGMDSRAVVARFEAERQALALMNHPCIARVIDAGATALGRPFFVMEYVEGERITKYCDQHRLDTKQRLELFIQVCGGVQHAHQKAVIHRDLKPSNILVTEIDGKPVPKIIDFGVAKAVEQTLADGAMHTLMGNVVGTPEYMSPEQADATSTDIDTRTDVYALGAVLYELLSGTRPFSSTELRRAGVQEIQRIIREVDPPRPSTRISSLGGQATTVSERRHTVPKQLSNDLRGDLDWITMKALAKERERRYDTANGLAMDLGRFLNHEPVTASPPSPAYRLRKLVRRNRAAVTALAAVVAVLVVASVVSTSLYLRAERESARARSEEAKATQVSGFLTGMLAGVGPAAARGRDTTMLQEILAETDTRLGRDLGDQPEVEAALRDVLATTSVDLGDYDSARRNAERSIALKDQVFGHDDHRTAITVALLGKTTMFQGDFVTADSLLTWSDSLVSARLGQSSVEALEIRAARLENLNFAGQLDEAAALAEDIIARKRGTTAWGDDATLLALYNLAQIRGDQQRYAEADSLHGVVVPLLEEKLGADHPNTLAARVSWGLTLTYAERYAEAESIMVDALANSRRILGDDHQAVQTAVNNLAIIYARTGQVAKAEPLYREMIEVGERTLGPLHPEQLAGIVNFASFLLQNDRFEESIGQATIAIDGFKQSTGDDFIGCGYARRTRGTCYRKLGRTSAAIADFAESYRVFSLIYGPDDNRAHDAAGRLAEIYEEQGNAAEAAVWRGRSQ